MLPSLFLASLVFILATAQPVPAQLGPKDDLSLTPFDLARVKVGDPAPDFVLEDMDGKRISLSDFRGKKNVVLVFNRGYW